MITETELLRRFADEKSEAAFTELVRQRIDFVYGVALRQVGGDVHLAEEVAQNVFLGLARKASAISRRPVLVSWLYTSTRLAAAQAVRTKSRWINRQQEAHHMQEASFAGTAADPDWHELRPVLDDAMHELGEADRTAILLRYFEGRPLVEVGRALGVAENAARMRVDRALDKLRGCLARRGITSTAAALGAAIAAQPAVAAPAGLAATVAGSSLATFAAGSGGGVAIPFLMSMTKIKIGALCALLFLGTGAYKTIKRQIDVAREAGDATAAGQAKEILFLRKENMRLKDEYRSLAQLSTPASAPVAASGGGEVAPVESHSLDALHLFSDLVKQGVIPSNVIDRIPFMGSDGKLTAAFSDLFAVTPAEKEALQRVLDESRRQLSELGLANAVAQRQADGSLLIDIPPFAGGSEIHDRLLEAFQQTLGPERNASFLSMVDGQIQTSLANFGGAHQTLTLSRNQAATNPAQAFTIQDARSLTSPSGGHSNHSDGTSIPDLNVMADRYGSIARLIPPDF